MLKKEKPAVLVYIKVTPPLAALLGCTQTKLITPLRLQI
tara:strand:+ start:347 stop:463 length:117 start_codon:yes stop_codon:yes gene_type:complete